MVMSGWPLKLNSRPWPGNVGESISITGLDMTIQGVELWSNAVAQPSKSLRAIVAFQDRFCAVIK
jgi:hypothetical protein